MVRQPEQACSLPSGTLSGVFHTVHSLTPHTTSARLFLRFKLLPDCDTYKEIEYRQRGIHPAERCVKCFTQHDADLSSSGTNGRHMKTEGRKPSPMLSACRLAVVKDSRRRTLQPHCEMEDDHCFVTLSASREVCDESNEFPFFHAEARQPKVSQFGLLVRAQVCTGAQSVLTSSLPTAGGRGAEARREVHV